jgi:hypothetical protein
MTDQATQKSPTSFAEFWPYYLGEHRSPISRGLHYMGTSMAVGAALAAAFTGQRRWLLIAPLLGYGPAWVGHFKVEHNRPATFKHPLWSLVGDFKMLRMALRGEIRDELRRLYGSASPAADAPRLS